MYELYSDQVDVVCAPCVAAECVTASKIAALITFLRDILELLIYMFTEAHIDT